VGQGYMTEALTLVCDFAFTQLNLQRIEASCLPNNEPSKAVLRHCGFEEEGYAKAYLQINGKREDHLLWGRNNPDLKAKDE
jgi:ribosomal-protein-alanine N-acetyltransferase